MNRATQIASDVARNPWFNTLAALASISSFLWLLVEKYGYLLPRAATTVVEAAGQVQITVEPSLFPLVSFVLSTTVFLGLNFYSVLVRRENQCLREVGHYIHMVNHTYRDVLFSAFSGSNPITDKKTLLEQEKRTLMAVCQIVSSMFTQLVGGMGHPCVVTVKLLMKKKRNSHVVAFTYARSHVTIRDKEQPTEFQVGIGANTAFDIALVPRPPGECSHFFSPDLTRLGPVYKNERASWKRHYRSAIVVPIRAVNRESKSGDVTADDIGFLTVDTLHRNRLNGTHHVELMSALADQMYNFMCLMRGKYNVLVG